MTPNKEDLRRWRQMLLKQLHPLWEVKPFNSEYTQELMRDSNKHQVWLMDKVNELTKMIQANDSE